MCRDGAPGDRKGDVIAQADYYSMAGFFAASLTGFVSRPALGSFEFPTTSATRLSAFAGTAPRTVASTIDEMINARRMVELPMQ